MARYTGPKHKLARKEKQNILGKESASLQRRLNILPGMHGRKRVTRRLSEFGIQLREKQKVKTIYGLLEKQFKNLVQAVGNKKGDTSELLVSALETRLDNVIYRLGFAKTRAMARQLVSHGHIFVNDKRLNIPSYHVKVDDVVALETKIQGNQQILKLQEEKGTNPPPFLKKEGLAGKLLRVPKKDDVEVPVDLRLIIEYYSR